MSARKSAEYLSAIILAAGSGQRMGAACNKVLLPLAGRPVLCHTVELWLGLVDTLVIGAQSQDIPQLQAFLAPYGEKLRLVEGGPNRAASLQRALGALPPALPLSADGQQELIAVHDGARPLTAPGDIRRVIQVARSQGAAILAAPVSDTIRYINGDREDLPPGQEKADGCCGQLIPREQLLAAQTPQIFRRDWLEQAYAGASDQELAYITDDAARLQAQGHRCAFVWASQANLKLTRPEDMPIAEAILQERWRLKE